MLQVYDVLMLLLTIQLALAWLEQSPVLLELCCCFTTICKISLIFSSSFIHAHNNKNSNYNIFVSLEIGIEIWGFGGQKEDVSRLLIYFHHTFARTHVCTKTHSTLHRFLMKFQISRGLMKSSYPRNLPTFLFFVNFTCFIWKLVGYFTMLCLVVAVCFMR